MRRSGMRLALLLVATTAHAAPDPCTATALHLTKATEVTPVVFPICEIRGTDEGRIDTDKLRKTFPSLPKIGEPGYNSTELTLQVTSAKQLGAAVTCEAGVPAIAFAKNHVWILVRQVSAGSHMDIPRAFDDGKTWLLAERTHGGCAGGARYAAEPRLQTLLVVVPADRTIASRACFVPPASPCPANPK